MSEIIHNGDFDSSGVSLEEAKALEAQQNQSSSESSEQELEEEQTDTAEEAESQKEEDSETETGKKPEAEEEKEDDDESESGDESEEGESDKGDDELTALEKKQQGIAARKAKLEEQIESEEQALVELRQRKRSTLKEKIKVAEEDVQADYFSDEDKKQMDAYLRGQGYVKVSDLEKDNIQTAKDSFIDSHSEYQDKEVMKELETYASIYKAPESPEEQTLILKRAHVDRLRDQQRQLKHSPESVETAKKQVRLAGDVAGGGKGGAPRAPQKTTGKGISQSERDFLITHRGWSEEDFK